MFLGGNRRWSRRWVPLIYVPGDGQFVVIFFKTTYNKTKIRFLWYSNNQGLGKF